MIYKTIEKIGDTAHEIFHLALKILHLEHWYWSLEEKSQDRVMWVIIFIGFVLAGEGLLYLLAVIGDKFI